MTRRLTLSLDAVIVAVTAEQPRILTTTRSDQAAIPALPFGPLNTDRDATLELGLRHWVVTQTGHDLGYVEQLYTFGDRERQSGAGGTRHLSVAYLALVREERPAPGAAWLDCYDILPWEERRHGVPAIVTDTLLPALTRWAGNNAARRQRVESDFGGRRPWDPIRVLERYELLYEARLVPEYQRDRGDKPKPVAAGTELAYDHRRIAATALGRLRGKLRYRPVVFELLPEKFSLFLLQRTVEALTGTRLHKQNFRRLIEHGRLVEATGTLDRPTRGRPAELFRFRREVVRARLF